MLFLFRRSISVYWLAVVCLLIWTTILAFFMAQRTGHTDLKVPKLMALDVANGSQSTLSTILAELKPTDLSTANHQNPSPSPQPPSPASVIPALSVASKTTLKSFDGRPLRKVKTIRMRVTAYSPDARSCGKWADGITASGYSVWTNGMKLVAADTDRMPFGTIVSVPGYHGGVPVQVLDRGGAIKGKRLDVLYPTHERALQWGVQHLDVDVWEYAD